MSEGIYGKTWASEVVEAFIKKYACGSKKLAELLNISEFKLYYILVRALRTNQTRWEVLKRVIKHIQEDKSMPSCLATENYLKYVKYLASFEVINLKESEEISEKVVDIMKLFDASLYWT